MTHRYDITVKVNLTMEYERPQRPGWVKEDAHSLLDGFDSYLDGLHAWTVEVSGGKASVIDGRFAEGEEE